MGNEILRRNSPNSDSHDLSIASFGENQNPKIDARPNSLISFFTDEKKAVQEKLALEDSKPVQKPKLGGSTTIFIELLVITILLLYFCISVNNVFFMSVLIFIASAIMPITMVYFFNKLNTRGRLRLSTVIRLLATGVITYLILDFLFDKFFLDSSNYAYIFTSIRSIVELVVILFIVGFTLKALKQHNIMTVLYIASILSAGFALSRSLVEMFEVMFIRIQISQNGVISAVGAIINSTESAKYSIDALIENIFYIGFFKPFVFISLTVINGFALRFLFYNKNGEQNPFGLIVLLVFSLVTIGFSSLTSSINFLQILYTVCTIIVTGFALYHVIENSIKTENYI